MSACQTGDRDQIISIFEANPNLDVNQTVQEGTYETTLLRIAGRKNDVVIVKELLTHPEIQVNKQTGRTRRTALMDAAEDGT